MFRAASLPPGNSYLILPLRGLLPSRDGQHAHTLGFWDVRVLAVVFITAELTIPITIAEKMLANASACVELTRKHAYM